MVHFSKVFNGSRDGSQFQSLSQSKLTGKVRLKPEKKLAFIVKVLCALAVAMAVRSIDHHWWFTNLSEHMIVICWRLQSPIHWKIVSLILTGTINHCESGLFVLFLWRCVSNIVIVAPVRMKQPMNPSRSIGLEIGLLGQQGGLNYEPNSIYFFIEISLPMFIVYYEIHTYGIILLII